MILVIILLSKRTNRQNFPQRKVYLKKPGFIDGQILDELSIHKFYDLIGRTGRLDTRKGIEHWKAQGSDFAHIDLPPGSRTNLNSRKSVTMENDGYEEEQIQRRANHWVHQAG